MKQKCVLHSPAVRPMSSDCGTDPLLDCNFAEAAASLRGRGSDVYEAKTGMDVAMHSSSGEEGDNLDEEEDDEFEDDSVNAIQATCQAPASGGNGDQDFSRLSSRGSIDAILN